jgi:hypothetical protein
MEKGASSMGMMKADADGWMVEDDGQGEVRRLPVILTY